MQSVAMANSIKNDEWITNGEAPDPEVLPKVPGFHLLIRPVSVKQETKGGILLPDSTKNDIAYLTTVGKVLKVGTLLKDATSFLTVRGVKRVTMFVMVNIQVKFFYKGVTNSFV